MDRPPRTLDRTDRSRLQQVQQTDLTEGRLNEDFLFWLKNKGPTYLLIAMLFLCAILGYQRWTRYKADKFDAAWRSLAEVEGGQVASLEEVADDKANRNAGAVAMLARLAAADRYMWAIQIGRDVITDSPTAAQPEAKLSDEDRARYLERAERLYQQLVTDAAEAPELAIHAINGLFGLAAVQESRGEFAKARQLYEQAAARAAVPYPTLAEAARTRAGTLDRLAQATPLPDDADVSTPGTSGGAHAQMQPAAPIDDALRKLIFNEPTMISVP